MNIVNPVRVKTKSVKKAFVTTPQSKMVQAGKTISVEFQSVKPAKFSTRPVQNISNMEQIAKTPVVSKVVEQKPEVSQMVSQKGGFKSGTNKTTLKELFTKNKQFQELK